MSKSIKPFINIADHAMDRNTPIFIGWPRHCRYWHTPRVQRFLRKHGGTATHADGCAYDPVSPEGRPIKKPWRVHCFNSTLPQHLNTTCQHSRQRQHLEGAATRRSQHYPPQMTSTIHVAIAIDLGWQNSYRAAVVDSDDESIDGDRVAYVPVALTAT